MYLLAVDAVQEEDEQALDRVAQHEDVEKGQVVGVSEGQHAEHPGRPHQRRDGERRLQRVPAYNVAGKKKLHCHNYTL